jgi:hypothetical protein
MKLATWNCAMGLKKKHQALLSLGAEVLVIQECSKPDIEQLGQTPEWSSKWFGKNQNKGLGRVAQAYRVRKSLGAPSLRVVQGWGF